MTSFEYLCNLHSKIGFTELHLVCKEARLFWTWIKTMNQLYNMEATEHQKKKMCLYSLSFPSGMIKTS